MNKDCQGRGNSSLHAANVIWRQVIRDDWRQYRNKSELKDTMMVKPEVSVKNEKFVPHGARPNQTISAALCLGRPHSEILSTNRRRVTAGTHFVF